MSTETPEKHMKGAREGTEKKSKKRRREEQAQDESAKIISAPIEVESTPAKKQKKAKKERAEDGKAASVRVLNEVGEDGALSKKEKKKKGKSNDAQGEEVVVGMAKPAAQASTEFATARNAKHMQEEESQESSKKQNKKKKKARRASLQEANGTSDDEDKPPAISDSQPSASATTHSAIVDKLLETKSPFTQVTASFYLALSPIAHHFPLEGLCAEHISPMLLTYYPPLKGVVLSYNNPRMSEEPEKGARAYSSKEAKVVLGRSIDEYAVTYVWLTADFLIFKPDKDTVLEGYVNLQNESILGLICYNYFNAGIERSRIPEDWQWVEHESAEEDAGMSRKGRRYAAGHYVDASGKKIEGRLVFKVKDFEATAGAENGSGSINIYGTLLAERHDAKVDNEERQKTLVRDRPPQV